MPNKVAFQKQYWRNGTKYKFMYRMLTIFTSLRNNVKMTGILDHWNLTQWEWVTKLTPNLNEALGLGMPNLCVFVLSKRTQELWFVISFFYVFTYFRDKLQFNINKMASLITLIPVEHWCNLSKSIFWERIYSYTTNIYEYWGCLDVVPVQTKNGCKRKTAREASI